MQVSPEECGRFMGEFHAALRQRYAEQDAPPSSRRNVDETGVTFGETGRCLFFKDGHIAGDVNIPDNQKRRSLSILFAACMCPNTPATPPPIILPGEGIRLSAPEKDAVEHATSHATYQSSAWMDTTV